MRLVKAEEETGPEGGRYNEVRSFFFFRFYLFLERGEGKAKETYRNINVWFLLTFPPTPLPPKPPPPLGTWPAT